MSSALSMAYAHSLPERPPPDWHTLESHLASTRDMARAYAEAFGGGDAAALAGWLHDLGKFAPDWQQFLRETGPEAHVLGEDGQEAPKGRVRGPDHSSAGAIHAARLVGTGPAMPLQFAIAGHHAGLADKLDLDARLKLKKERYDSVLACLPAAFAKAAVPALPHWLLQRDIPKSDMARRWEMFTRLVFSALVDADFLDTESFYDAARGAGVRGALRLMWHPLSAYFDILDDHVNALSSGAVDTPVNRWRSNVLEWCRAMGCEARGAFSLTVPTGGGKTLSSLAFALAHARSHRLKRVIIALPFTSILDQTAAVLRAIFTPRLGANALLEHHSAMEPSRETAASRIAAENWDAPLIVTTQVQLFESLFSNRPSACRKLHNVCDSVLILDEVQSLPAGLLRPILDQLQQLTTCYGVSLLLTTATQPSLHSRDLGGTPFKGLDPRPVEIVPQASQEALFEELRRVRVRWPDTSAPIAWEELADAIATERQALAIVHRRDDARLLWEVLQMRAGEAPYHLSALMCPAHRREVLGAIRSALARNESCRVVSTQLVEAGVDVDFPVVFRAMAGLESLAQAAGRCNREGRLPKGVFHVFNAPTDPPMGLKLHRDVAQQMRAYEPSLDLFHPATFERYFDKLYHAKGDLDVHAIQRERAALKFKTTASLFHMIEDAGETLVVPWGEAGGDAVEAMRRLGPSRDRLRALQPFGVSVSPSVMRRLQQAGRVELVADTSWVLCDETTYHPNLGLLVDPLPR